MTATTTDPDGWDAWRRTAAVETAALAEANAADEPGDVDGEQWVLRFDDKRPPLSLNIERHWAPKRRIARVLRNGAAARARVARIPALERCSVQLIWVVARADRRRDADNIVPTLKAMADGLVDAGVVRDDTPDLMVKPECIIELRRGEPAHLELVVTRLPALDPANGTPLDVVETALAPKHERPTRREATVGNLLDFEREHPGKADSARKAPLIRDYFDLTPVKYVDALIRAAATREALEHDAITAYALRAQITAGANRRARTILGRNP